MKEAGSYVAGLIERARIASGKLALMSAEEKNRVLLRMADALERGSDAIIKANAADVENAKNPGPGSKKMTPSEIDRLVLSPERIRGIANDVRAVAALPDPVGEEEGWTVPNGLSIRKVRVPFGVIGAVYENRPNVTVDIASLCVKSGNSCVLRGSASALRSNRALAEAVRPVLESSGLGGAVSFVDSPDRAAVDAMMEARGRLDLLIPRGGPELIRHTVENSKVPVIETGTGNCHVYVDESGDLEMAERIVLNAKCQRPSVCNAEEKLLVHRSIAKAFIPKIAGSLRENGVEIRACPETLKILPDAKPATEEDWPKEYLDLVIGIKVVGSVDEAIAHINRYNSKHTEAIITKSFDSANKFAKMVDAAAVMVNASTRFTDGGQFGFGAEVGISTQKLHARGPMGLRELTTYKYIVQGDGQIRG